MKRSFGTFVIVRFNDMMNFETFHSIEMLKNRKYEQVSADVFGKQVEKLNDSTGTFVPRNHLMWLK